MSAPPAPLSRPATPAARPATPAAAGWRLLVVGGGVGFLLARPVLWRLPAAAAVLLLGYLALALAAAAAAGRAPRGPLGWPAVLAAGLVAVVAVALAAGPAPPPPRADAAALALGAAAAVAEEALFRGALVRLLERAGWPVALAAPALAFALVHVPAYGPAAFPVDLGAGLLLGWQRLASGRWTVPAATHAAANLLVVILA